MKFNGYVTDLNIIIQFSRLVSIIAKQCKTLILKLTQDHLYIISDEDIIHSNFKLWIEIPQQTLFSNYTFEGVQSCNMIFLRVNSENLHNSLKSSNLNNCKSFLIKLSKKQTACLCMEFQQVSFGSKPRKLFHDIDVEIITRRFWPKFDEPSLPTPDLTIILHSIGHLRRFFDKLKSINRSVDIEITQDKKLILTLEGEGSEIKSTLTDLETNPNKTNLENSAKVKIDCKRFYNFVKSLHINPNLKIYCNINEERLIHFSFLQDEISVQLVLPHIQM